MTSCKVCLYYCRITNSIDGKGVCRRHAPDALAQAISGYMFPRVSEENWCGEFIKFEEEEEHDTVRSN